VFLAEIFPETSLNITNKLGVIRQKTVVFTYEAVVSVVMRLLIIKKSSSEL
jgi:hypothetical protein